MTTLPNLHVTRNLALIALFALSGCGTSTPTARPSASSLSSATPVVETVWPTYGNPNAEPCSRKSVPKGAEIYNTSVDAGEKTVTYSFTDSSGKSDNVTVNYEQENCNAR